MDDRRKRKTIAAIKAAFIELATTTEIGKITVKDLAEKADISRKTFYLYYLDINDLAENLENEIIEYIKSLLPLSAANDIFTNPYLILNTISESLDKYPEFTKFIANQINYSGFNIKLKEIIYQNLKELYLIDHHNVTPALDYTLIFISGGVLDTFKYWYYNDNNKSLVELSKMISNIIVNGIKIK